MHRYGKTVLFGLDSLQYAPELFVEWRLLDRIARTMDSFALLYFNRRSQSKMTHAIVSGLASDTPKRCQIIFRADLSQDAAGDHQVVLGNLVPSACDSNFGDPLAGYRRYREIGILFQFRMGLEQGGLQ